MTISYLEKLDGGTPVPGSGFLKKSPAVNPHKDLGRTERKPRTGSVLRRKDFRFVRKERGFNCE